MSGLEPEELTRLLAAAVEPVRPSPEAYQRIRAGIERRRWWKMPLALAGGVAMVGLVVLAVVAIRPQPSTNTLVEPATPPIVSSFGNEPGRSIAPATDGTGGTGGGGGRPDETTPQAPSTAPSVAPTSAPPPTATLSPTVTPTGPGGSSAPPMPTPVVRPASAGDVDGDGAPDQIRFSDTTMEIIFTRGGFDQVELTGLPALPKHAVVDIDSDGFGEVLVQTETNGGTAGFALFRYAGLATLMEVEMPPGVRLAAGVNGNQGTGFRCETGALEIVNGTSTDGSTFDTVTTVWSLSLDGLKQVESKAGIVTIPDDPSPFVAACGTMS